MKKAIYKNPKSGKYYAVCEKEDKTNELLTVFDDEGVLATEAYKVDKKGRAYQVADVTEAVTKNGFRVLRTVKPEG
ncbi:MAG: hypothetical protein IIY23_03795 [Erysipelotrichaceae bacterium]|nr:hypothetical protein [Erysipelotrichaceae bacterium]